MPTPAAIASECQSDPAGLGLAAPFLAAQDQAVADLLNLRSGAGSAGIVTDSVPKSAWLLLVAQGGIMLSTLGAATQAKWYPVIPVFTAVTDPVPINASTASIFAAAVSDGIYTQAQVNSVLMRPGSRAEVLFGAGTFLTAQQIGASR